MFRIYKKNANAYEVAMEAPRKAFASDPVVQELLSKNVSPEFMELFIIHWNALSSGFVQPVAGYLRIAGEKCQEFGYPEIASFFFKHTEEETGHDDWAAKDTLRLVARWNKKHPDQSMHVENLLAERMSPAVKRYHDLHERIIYSDHPYAELAIDMEIELITKQFGPRMILQCVRKMGPHILWEMSFLREHVRFDFGHTDTNEEMIEALLKKQPQFFEPLVETGKVALIAYTDLLHDCYDLSKQKTSFWSKAA